MNLPSTYRDLGSMACEWLGFVPAEVRSIRLLPDAAVVEQLRREDGQFVLNARGDAVQRRFVLLRWWPEADPNPLPKVHLFRRKKAA